MHPIATTGSSNAEAAYDWRPGARDRRQSGDRSLLRANRAASNPGAPGQWRISYRSYDSADLGRLSFIRRARDLGFTLDQIRLLLELAEQRDRDCGDVDALAREHLADVERKIADLSALRRELLDLIESCRRGKVEECRIIEALSPA